jgi:hypothetical protein
VLVELTDQRVHAARVEGRPIQAVERGEDSDVGRVAAKGATPDLRQLLDVVTTDVHRARLERHDVAQLRRRHLLCHHSDKRPPAVGNRCDHAVGDGDRRCDQRRFETPIERLEQSAQDGAYQEPEDHLCRAQAEQTDERTADDRGEQRLVGAVDQPQHPAKQRHQQGAAQDAVPEWLRLGGTPPDAGDHLGGRVQSGTDNGADASPDSVDRIAEHGAGRSTEGHPPDQRVENPARAASSASIRIPHDREYCGVSEAANEERRGRSAAGR